MISVMCVFLNVSDMMLFPGEGILVVTALFQQSGCMNGQLR